MSNTKFENVQGFVDWAGKPGNNVSFPFPGGEGSGWEVQITAPVEAGETGDQEAESAAQATPAALVITSGYYTVASNPAKYGAPMIFGHTHDFAGQQASGVISFGFSEDGIGKLDVTNRRRLTAADTLAKGEVLVAITNNAAPDRVVEPVAVVANSADREKIANMSAADMLEAILGLRDGVEMDAARLVQRWAVSDSN